jgi:hypothetical protein
VKQTKTFKVNDKVEIGCESVGTRYGFRHDAFLMVNGVQYGNKAKCCYYNRTWEKFEFESVLHKAIEATTALTDAEKEQFKKQLNDKHGY